jgi:biotin transporter BioY
VADIAGALTVIVVVYALGWLQLALVTSMGVLPAFAAGVLPFLVPDALKAVGALVLAPFVREAIAAS